MWQRSALLGANYVRLSGQAVRMANPPVPFDDLGKNLQEGLTIGSREKDRLSRIAARGDVIYSSLRTGSAMLVPYKHSSTSRSKSQK